jgi:hypothetical protein
MSDAVMPRDYDAMLNYLRGAPSPLVAEIARTATPVGELATWRMQGSRRRLWERSDPMPDRFLVVGDAVMSFNPLYGQGMSVAAVEAATLRRFVSDPAAKPEGLGARVQAAFAPLIDTVFGMVIGIDAFYPSAELHGVEPPSVEAIQQGRAITQLATEDAETSRALKFAAHFFDVAGLQSDSIQAKLAQWIASGRQPQYVDPTSIPPPLI